MHSFGTFTCILPTVVICFLTFFPTKASSICTEDQFLCRNGDECISRTWRCDTEADCLDGSDEENCVAGCQFPSKLHHGTVLYENSEDPELQSVAPDNYILQFRCNKGYQLAGPKTLFCINGEWSDKFPQCIQMNCPAPPVIANGTYRVISGVSQRPTIGSFVRYSCNKGFELEDENLKPLTCKLNGTSAIWFGDIPRCTETEVCPDPGSSPDGWREGNCCLKGDTLKFYCNEDYTIVGQREIECMAGGSWNAPRARCQPDGITCPVPPGVPNGKIESDNEKDYFLPGDEVYVTCNEGFAVLDGSDQSYCDDDGTWSDALGTCEAAPCKLPEIPLNGSIPKLQETNETTFPYGYDITYACNDGFRLIGSSWNSCKGGRWFLKTPKCDLIRCYDPGTPEKGVRKGSSFEVGDKVSFSCFAGYTLLGSFERYCLPNGLWSGELTRCDKESNYCPDPGVPINGMKTGSVYDEGATVHYSCQAKFSLVGSENRTCRPNKTWTGEEPRCLGPYDFDNNVDVSERLKLVVKETTEAQMEETEKYWESLRKLAGSVNFTALEDLEMFLARKRILNLNFPGRIILYFIFDSSGSVGADNFRISIDFAKAMVRKVGISENGARAGALTFSSEAVSQFKPTDASTTEEVIVNLDAIEYRSGGTSISAALEKLYEDEIPHVAEWLGRNTRTVVFILTDGKANMGGNPQSWADKLKATDVEIYCIGITGSIEKNTLYDIATHDENEEHVFILSNYTTMTWLIQQITNGTIDYSECGLGLERIAAGHGRQKRAARPRIIGGEKAPEPWPWMAALYISDEPNKGPKGGTLQCGGSIVGRQWILTAAHCLVIADKDKKYKVRDLEAVVVKLGLTHLKNESNLLEFESAEFKVHENYDPVTVDYDIALIKLDRIIEYSIFVRPICLPPEKLPEMTTLYKNSEEAYVAGWGDDKRRGSKEKIRQKHVNHLKELRLPLQSDERCRESLKDTVFIYTERMFCAGSGLGEVDTCQGDSGGPMMQSQLNKEGQVYWVQVGLVSWGIGCGQLHTYGYYTHVQRLRNWVVNTMKPN